MFLTTKKESTIKIPEENKNKRGRIIFAGTAANGGIPQWDCTCNNCMEAEKDKSSERAMSSLIITTGKDNHYEYTLIDMCPSISEQLKKADMRPKRAGEREGFRESRLKEVFFTHGHEDHSIGLGMLSNGKSYDIPVHLSKDLSKMMFGISENANYFSMIGRLDKDYVKKVEIYPSKVYKALGKELELIPFSVPHTEKSFNDEFYPSRTFAYKVTFTSSGSSFVYAPDIANFTPEFMSMIQGNEALIVDGTFFYDNEMERSSNGKVKLTSYDLGHVPIEHSLELLKDSNVDKVIYTHFNHTNPLVGKKDSEAKRIFERAGGSLKDLTGRYVVATDFMNYWF